MFITQRVSSVTTSILYESHQISKQESEIYTYLFSYICNQLLFTTAFILFAIIVQTTCVFAFSFILLFFTKFFWRMACLYSYELYDIIHFLLSFMHIYCSFYAFLSAYCLFLLDNFHDLFVSLCSCRHTTSTDISNKTRLLKKTCSHCLCLYHPHIYHCFSLKLVYIVDDFIVLCHNHRRWCYNK